MTSDSVEHKIVGSGEVNGLWAGVVTRRVIVGGPWGSAHVFFFFFSCTGCWLYGCVQFVII